jgi:hypothetical protein
LNANAAEDQDSLHYGGAPTAGGSNLPPRASNNGSAAPHRNKLKNQLANLFQPACERQNSLKQTDTRRVIPFELPVEETFEQKIAKLEQRNLVLPPRPPSGDVRLRKQNSNMNVHRGLVTAQMGHASKQHLRQQSQPRRNDSGSRGMSELDLQNHTGRNQMQGGQRVFADQTNITQVTVSVTGMSGVMTDASEQPQVDILDPSAGVHLTEDELYQIRQKPFMNANLPRQGSKPQSNQILDAETLLIETKREKVIEIFKASTEVFEILEAAKKDPLL